MERDEWDDAAVNEDAAPANEIEHRGTASDDQSLDPDVYLDVPAVKVDKIDLEVENLRARVSLQAEVLDLLKLNVGADVFLGHVGLTIEGVEAQALLKVRLHNVRDIVDRVLTTIDRHPEFLEHLTRGLGGATESIGRGAGEAVERVGRGAGGAVEEVGSGAGEAVGELGRGTSEAVGDIGKGVGSTAESAGRAVEEVGGGAGDTARSAGKAVEDVGGGARDTVSQTGNAVGAAGRSAGEVVEDVAGGSREQHAHAGREGSDDEQDKPPARRKPQRSAGEGEDGGSTTGKHRRAKTARK